MFFEAVANDRIINFLKIFNLFVASIQIYNICNAQSVYKVYTIYFDLKSHDLDIYNICFYQIFIGSIGFSVSLVILHVNKYSFTSSFPIFITFTQVSCFNCWLVQCCVDLLKVSILAIFTILRGKEVTISQLSIITFIKNMLSNCRCF